VWLGLRARARRVDILPRGECEPESKQCLQHGPILHEDVHRYALKMSSSYNVILA